MKEEGQTGAEEVEDINKMDVKKRFYLGIIYRLKKIRSFSQCDEEVAHLLMRNKDIESD
jgi:hypothetical protein